MKYKNMIYISFLISFFIVISGVYGEDSSMETTLENDNNEINDLNMNIRDNNISSQNELVSDANNIYFDSSSLTDGDGSSSNPYKTLTNSRLKNGYTAYFKNGDYTLNNYKSLSSTTLTLIGESNNAVIHFDDIAFVINKGSTLTLKSITLSNAIVKNAGTLTATNTVFRDGIAVFNESGIDYGNTEGGAIYMTGSSPKATLTNCDFINNSAAYGGSIFVNSGTIIISDCNFINNTAKNYGGAIAAVESSSVTATNTKFINCTSKGDTAGVIYTQESSLKTTSCDFINCSAHFGGAICSLKSTLTVTTCNFINNTAKYEGGAIYKMYGTLSVSGSSFTSNTALSGGALYLDNCSSTVKNSNFNYNTAKSYGGAIYANFVSVTTTTDVFAGNKAKVSDNVYTQTSHIYQIGSSDYHMFVNNYTFSGVLPSRYSLVDEGYVSAIKDQEDGGNCWSFAAIAALESCVLKASNYTYDFSEENLKNLMEYYSEYGWKMDTNNGGYDEMAIGYLTSWLGPVLEEEDVYDDHSTISTVLNSFMHVQNIVYLPKRTSYTDLNNLKKAIMTYGAVAVGIYYDSSYYNKQYASYYYNGLYSSSTGNHAVTVVGWDDNYDKSKFKHTPSGNGAFIVKNSWNTDWGDNGYFYVSYYDPVVYKVNCKHAAYTFLLNDTIRFNKNYQYDISGPTDFYNTGEKTIYYKNIFQSTGDDLLAGVSTYFDVHSSYTVSIYVNNALKLTQSGSSNPGYYTINLKKFIPLKEGDEFEVVFKVSASSSVYIPICEKSSITRVFASTTLSYISTDGSKWKDLYGYREHWFSFFKSYQVACIKAFTTTNMLSTRVVMDNYEFKVFENANILARVYDGDNNLVNGGNLTFSIDNNDYTVNVLNGVANLTVSLNNSGIYNVSARFNGVTSYFDQSSATALITVNKHDLKVFINASDIVYSEDLIINVTMSSNLTCELDLYINNKSQKIKVINGNSKMNISGLSCGQYDIDVKFLEDSRYYSANSNISVNVFKLKSNLKLNVSNICYGDKLIVNANLAGVSGENISVEINNKKYIMTIISGYSSIQIDDALDFGTYDAVGVFNGNDNCFNATDKITFNINKASFDLNITSNTTEYGNDLIVKTTIPIKDKVNLTFLIDGKIYVIESYNGIAEFKISNLSAGNYTITGNYFGDKNHNKATTKSYAVISKLNTKITINTTAISYGEDEIITVKLNYDINENVNVIIDNSTQNLKLTNGEGVIIKSGLSGGLHNIKVVYIGNTNYTHSISTFEFKVNPANLDLNLTVNPIEYGNDLIIKSKLSTSDKLNLTFLINGKLYTTESDIELKVSDLDAGNYTVIGSYLGGDNYNKISKKITAVVNKAKSSLTIAVSDITYGDSQIITAKSNPSINDDVIVILANETYHVKLTDGEGQLIKSDLNVGSYNVKAVFNGNNNYLASEYATSFKVNPNNITLKIIANNIDYGEDLLIRAFVSTKDTLDLTIFVNNKNYIIKSKNGEGQLILSNLDAGNYTIVGSYRNIVSNVTCVINKISSNVIISASDIHVGDNESITITLTPNINENISIILDDIGENINLINGKSTIIKSNLASGIHTIKIAYDGNNNYQACENTLTFNVLKLDNFTISVPNEVISENNTSKIEITVDNAEKGNITFTINNISYKGQLNNGKTVIEVSNLNFKDYPYNLQYESNDKYAEKKISGTISVRAANIQLITKNIEKYYGDSQRFMLQLLDLNNNPIANATLHITLNNISYTKTTNANGKTSVPTSLNTGNYTVISEYSEANIKSVNNIVVKPTVTGKDVVKVFRNATQYIATFKDADGNYLAEGTAVEFNINGVFYTRTVKSNGTAKLNLNLEQGTYVITAINGVTGEKYANTVKILPKITENSGFEMYYRNGSKYAVRLIANDGNPVGAGEVVIFNINGVFYNRSTNASGFAKLNINLQPGDYIITAEYGGCRVSDKISVKPVLLSNDLVMKYKDGSKYSVTLLNGQGKALSNAKVTFNINGVLYNRYTNENGVANLNINLQKGKYIITASYENAVTSNKITIN